MADQKEPHRSTDLLNIPGKSKTIAKLLSDQSASLPAPSAPSLPSPPDRKTFKMDMNDDLLARVQAFLPQMQVANSALKSQDLSKLDIENLEGKEDNYIEMNLGLGVYDIKSEGHDQSDTDSDHEIMIPSNGKTDATKPSIMMLDPSE
ncbi:hypothetical protein DM01DRAFT_1338448 [Hesseltinella vesiculosa]|uniref:Uncharacterized protein n=1 Tax=Hesseltinella vesiculosa TaxID=101127 RepID=A0A1X2G9X5_9FUNG|nr:hypothetical protein DM01DRAFT_1338448 [Hesseltinella vesiculosa]